MAPKKGSGDKERPLVDVWVVILCGLPGSGKSTLRRKLVEKGWEHANQDEMGTQEACKASLIKSLKNKRSCVIDRCNVTSSERRLWMQYATAAVEKQEAKGVKLHFEAVWMATTPEVCKERAKLRAESKKESHETLSADKADEVIESFLRGMRIPERTGQEPYEGVHFVATDADVDLVVRRYADPLHVEGNVVTSSSSSVVAAANQCGSRVDSFHQDPRPAAHDPTAGTEVLIIRHGERADRARDRDGGWVDDPPLTKDGRETAKRAGLALRSLPELPWAAVYSSPFYRCLQTANEAAAELGLPVRIEPGLSELCIEKIFEEAPSLRPPAESLQGAMTRAEVDLSCAPHMETLPHWPEEPRGANKRVVESARVLAARHPGQAILIVCHSHSIVELTRHLPKSGGGLASSTAGYCALSHISPGGRLMRCLDLSYLKAANASPGGSHVGVACSSDDAGCWEGSWRWVAAETVDFLDGAVVDKDLSCEAVEILLDMGLSLALERFQAFRTLFDRGSASQQAMWQEGWACRGEEVRAKLRKAYDAQLFPSAALLAFSPPSRARATEPYNLFPGPEDLANEEGDHIFEDMFHATKSVLAFPSTAHLTNLGAVMGDDKMCGEQRQRLFCGGTRRVSIEEKIDGANVGLSLDSQWQVRMQNRSKMITWNSDPQFAGLEAWLDKHRSTLCELLERNNDILFGEWCQYVHTVQYAKLPGYFVAFDIYDKRKDAFLSRTSFHTRLQRATGPKIPVVPMICAPQVFTSIDDVVALLKADDDPALERLSVFGSRSKKDSTSDRQGKKASDKSVEKESGVKYGVCEGVYLRIDADVADDGQESYLVDRCKLVRGEFRQAIVDVDKHGFSGNGKNELSMDLAVSYIEECYTCAAVMQEEVATPARQLLRAPASSSSSTCAAVEGTGSLPAQGKYPTTPHLPFSPGVNSDDTLLADCMSLLRKEVVVTEKLDGGNCCIKGGQVFARTHAQPATHESFSAVKQLSYGFAAQLGDIELFGENMQGIHSIEYKNLTSFFYVFAARSDGKWLAWDDVVDLAQRLDLPTVPVVFRGRFDTPAQLQGCIESWSRDRSAVGEDVNPEGFVLRRVCSFANSAFADNLAKYVRANHIQTDPDWKRKWRKAEIGDALPDRGEFAVVMPSPPQTEQVEGSLLPPGPSLCRQESRPLPPAFSLWLQTAILEELSPDEATPLIDCVQVILQGASTDPEALESAIDVLRDGGAPLCAAALPKSWQSDGGPSVVSACTV